MASQSESISSFGGVCLWFAAWIEICGGADRTRLPERDFVVGLSFNVGVELGQLAIILEPICRSVSGLCTIHGIE